MVESQRKLSTRRYIAAFFITLGIFVLGLLLGAFVSNIKVEKIQQLQSDFRIELLSLDIQKELLQEKICTVNEANNLNEELVNLAERLTSMETNLGKTDKRVTDLKKYYSLIEIKHYLFLKEMNNKCKRNNKLFLYFYSNDEKECPNCQSQGYILSYLRTKYDNVRVYSFDINLKDQAIKTFINLYNVTEVPTVLLDGNKTLGYVSREILEIQVEQNKTDDKI